MGLFQMEEGAHHCRKCEHWGGAVANGRHALCVRGGGSQATAMPESGCAFWATAIGADDEHFSSSSRIFDETKLHG